jgi:NodT family efflux transporter outer membrane factor (OMF) lipoprotein
MRFICACGFCILLLTSCAVGPDFKAPVANVPPGWQGVSAPAPDPISVAVSEPVALVDWWKSFDDNTLTSLIERAIRSNLDVRQAGARIRQARAERRVGGAALWPTLDSFASYSRSGSGGGSSSGGGGGSEQSLYEAGLDAAWELDIFGGTRRNIEALSADLLAAVEDRRDVLVTLISEVGINYIDLRGLQRQIAIAEKNLQAQRKSVSITSQLFEAGFVGGLDVANAKAQASTTASQIPVLESAVRTTIYNLSVLLGEEPTSLVQALNVAAPIPITPPEVPVGLPSDLLRRRPDIRRAEAQIHAATARIGAATADLFPRFFLNGSLAFSGEDLSSAARWSSRIWSLGPSVQWPIFNAGRIRWSIEVQRAIEEQTLLAYEQSILTALNDVETALVNYAKEQEHLKLLEEAVVNSRKALDLAMELYTGGQTDFLNVLAAQRSLYDSEDALVQSTRALSVDLVSLYKALGGGWERNDGLPG